MVSIIRPKRNSAAPARVPLVNRAAARTKTKMQKIPKKIKGIGKPSAVSMDSQKQKEKNLQKKKLSKSPKKSTRLLTIFLKFVSKLKKKPTAAEKKRLLKSKV